MISTFYGANVTSIPSGYLDFAKHTLKNINTCFYFSSIEFIPDDFLNGYTKLEHADNILGTFKNLRTVGNRVISNCPVLKSGGLHSTPNINSHGPSEYESNFQSVGDDYCYNCPNLISYQWFINKGHDVYIGDNFGMDSRGILLSGGYVNSSTRFHIGNNFMRNGILDTMSGYNVNTSMIIECGDNFMMDSQSKYYKGDIWTNEWNFCKRIGNNFMSGCSNLIKLTASNSNNLFLPNIEQIGDNFMNGCSKYTGRVTFKDNKLIERLPNNFMNGCDSVTSLDAMFQGCSLLKGGV